MATSGTVGQTQLDVAQVIEHAIRRCGKVPSTQSDEILQIARDNLWLVLQSMVNRGMNLWTVQYDILAVNTDQIVYDLPDGTVDILNTFYCNIDTVDPTWTVGATDWTGLFTDDTTIVMFSFIPTATGVLNLVTETSPDGVTWTTNTTYTAGTYSAGAQYWLQIQPAPNALYWRVRETVSVSLSLDAVTLVTQNNETSIARINRDDYTNMPNKMSQGQPTQFWFDRQINPRIWVWPRPQTAVGAISFWRYVEVQDVGALTNTLSIPNRWEQAIIWELAALLCFEIPGIDAERLKTVVAMAAQQDTEAGSEEYDRSPVYLAPNLSGYTQ